MKSREIFANHKRRNKVLQENENKMRNEWKQNTLINNHLMRHKVWKQRTFHAKWILHQQHIAEKVQWNARVFDGIYNSRAYATPCIFHEMHIVMGRRFDFLYNTHKVIVCLCERKRARIHGVWWASFSFAHSCFNIKTMQ